jgi:hypothetical protein
MFSASERRNRVDVGNFASFFCGQDCFKAGCESVVEFYDPWLISVQGRVFPTNIALMSLTFPAEKPQGSSQPREARSKRGQQGYLSI